MNSRWHVAAVHLPLFLGLSFVWVLGLGIVLAGALLFSGRSLVDQDQVMDWLGAGGIGGLTILQMTGLVALVVGLALFVSPDSPARVTVPAGDVRARLQRAFPVSFPVLWITIAALGGITVWTFPSWIAQELMTLVPDYQSTNELLTDMLRTAAPGGRAVVILAIVVSAPLFEELIFRGYLWRVIETSLGSGAALIGTTLLFAGFHLDPVQAVALLPIAAFLGWLRWWSGSLVPSILTHLMNNGLGVVLIYVTTSPEDEELGFGVAVAGLAATVLVAAAGAWLSRRAGGPAVP